MGRKTTGEDIEGFRLKNSLEVRTTMSSESLTFAPNRRIQTAFKFGRERDRVGVDGEAKEDVSKDADKNTTRNKGSHDTRKDLLSKDSVLATKEEKHGAGETQRLRSRSKYDVGNDVGTGDAVLKQDVKDAVYLLLDDERTPDVIALDI